MLVLKNDSEKFFILEVFDIKARLEIQSAFPIPNLTETTIDAFLFIIERFPTLIVNNTMIKLACQLTKLESEQVVCIVATTKEGVLYELGKYHKSLILSDMFYHSLTDTYELYIYQVDTPSIKRIIQPLLRKITITKFLQC